MSDISILHELIRDGARIPIEDHYDKKKVILTEPQQTNTSVTIYNLPEDSIIIKTDAFRSPDTVFNGSHGECKRSDYVIVTDTGESKVILYIELKAKKDVEGKIVQQLKGAHCFIVYCREIGKAFWNEQSFLNGYVHRYISIGHTSISKKPTRSKPLSGVHDHPERMMKISAPHHLQFNHLVGKL